MSDSNKDILANNEKIFAALVDIFDDFDQREIEYEPMSIQNAWIMGRRIKRYLEAGE